MTTFATKRLAPKRDVVAPDGSDVRALLALDGGSMAHFTLAPGATSRAVEHRTVDEIWFVAGGHGELWRHDGAREQVIALEVGVSLTIPRGTRFQFRAKGTTPLTIIAVTMPPWPGDGEATVVDGPWAPVLSP